MTTKRKIIESIQVLMASVSFGGPRDEGDAALLVNLWTKLLAKYTDADLDYMVEQHLLDPEECARFPQPGKLVKRLFERDHAGSLQVWNDLRGNAAQMKKHRESVESKTGGRDQWARICLALDTACIYQEHLAETDYGNRRRDAFCAAYQAAGAHHGE